MIYIMAGHIDHGKTAVVKALTGCDGDTLQDEKRRGITIDASFIPFGSSSIIDVPGHEGLIHNMAAEAGNIDVAIVVIDACEGVRAQTLEHVRILELLGTKQGVIVLNKCDIASCEQIDSTSAAVREIFSDSFLRQAPLIAVSARTHSGIATLRRELAAFTAIHRNSEQALFMPIDRIFTVKGAGTVATGTIYTGRIAQGDRLLCMPCGAKVTVRNIAVNGTNVPYAVAGMRAAVNLPALEVKDISKGDVLCADTFSLPCGAIGARLHTMGTPLPNEKLELIIGTLTTICRVHMRGNLAVIVPQARVCAAIGERFILRRLSPPATVAGGEVICLAPNNYKRMDTHTYEQLQAYAKGSEYALGYELAHRVLTRVELACMMYPLDITAEYEQSLKAHKNTEPLSTEAARVLCVYTQYGLKPPYLSAALREAQVPYELGRHIVSKLCKAQLVQLSDTMYVSAPAFATAYSEIQKQAACDGCTVASLRDALGISRKYARALLEYCDIAQLTINISDIRHLP